jgi:hypothetical protein
MGGRTLDHPYYTFTKLEKTFYEQYKTEKFDEHIYMKLKSIKSKDNEREEVYYERILQLTNCLYIKPINTYLTIAFKVGFHPYI